MKHEFIMRYVAPLCVGVSYLALSRAASRFRKPHVVVFAVDSLGQQDSSVPLWARPGGVPEATKLNRFYRTPHMERLAAAGVRFGEAYGGINGETGWFSLMTGLDPARRGLVGQELELPLPEMEAPDFAETGWRGRYNLLPQVMKKAGYQTLCAGVPEEDPAWLRTEFDHALVLEDTRGMGRTVMTCAERNCPLFACVRVGMEEWTKAQQPTEAERERVLARMPDFGEGIQVDCEQLVRYALAVERMDALLGRWMKYMERHSGGRRTLVIFTGLSGSDAPIQKSRAGNVAWGEQVGAVEPLRGREFSRYEGGGRVPMIVAWLDSDRRRAVEPAERMLPMTPGAFQSAIVSLQDVLPTLAALAERRLMGQVDGYDLADLLSGERQSERPPWVVRHFPLSHPNGRFYSTLRIREWKVIYNYYDDYVETGEPAWQLFNLEEDPSESYNLAEQPEYRKLLEMMACKLATYLGTIEAPLPQLTDPRCPRVNGRRQALGPASIRLPGEMHAGG